MKTAPIHNYLNGNGSDVAPYNGTINVINGKAINKDFTILHSRSVAEDLRFGITERHVYTGEVEVKNGQIVDDSISVMGKSLVHSA